jgi:hypothetical protein
MNTRPMPCPTRQPVCLEPLIAGETGQWAITITDQDDAPVNLAGATMEMRIAARGAVAASLAIGAGLQVTDAAAGQTLATLATGAMQPWLYDVHVITTDSGGRTHITPASLRILPQPTAP